jgi:DNA polymerase III delta subunit
VVQTETRGEEDRLLKGADFKLWCEGAEVDDLRAHSEGEQALQWLKQRATQRYRLALTKEQLKKVLLLSADSLALADTELYKLSLLKAADKLQPVPDSVLKANLSDNPAARFYELVDAIMLEQPDAQELLARLHGLNPDPHRLVAELRRRFLGLLALERGGEVQPPYLARQLRPLAGRWRGPRLSRAIQALAALEHGLKSGAYMGESSRDAELAGLQLFIRELTA